MKKSDQLVLIVHKNGGLYFPVNKVCFLEPDPFSFFNEC